MSIDKSISRSLAILYLYRTASIAPHCAA